MNRLIAGFAVLLFAAAPAAPAAADDSARASLGGNEFLAGGQVTLGGRVRRNAFVSGGDVTVESSVGGNLFAAGGVLRIARDARVAGDATLAGGTIEVDGPVGGDLHAYGERVVVNGVVDGDVRMAGEELRIGPDARIAGKVLYRSDEALDVAQGAELAGGAERSTSDRAWRRAARGASIIGGITISIGMVLLGAILVLGMPRFSREAAAAILSKPWHALFMLLAIVVIAIVRQVPVAGPIAWWLLFLAGVGAFTLRVWQGFRDGPPAPAAATR